MELSGYRELLEDLIGIKSDFFHEEKIGLFLEKLLKKMGFVTYRQEVKRSLIIDGKRKDLTHFNVLGEKGRGEKSFV